MAKKRNWSYADIRTQQCGLMECVKCGQRIAEGQFRYYMAHDRWFNDIGYVTQHRACSTDDPNWAKLDKEYATYLERNESFLAACLAFKAHWGVNELDELISDLKS